MQNLCRARFSKKELLVAEQQFVELLQWKLNTPTVYSFAESMLCYIENERDRRSIREDVYDVLQYCIKRTLSKFPRYRRANVFYRSYVFQILGFCNCTFRHCNSRALSQSNLAFKTCQYGRKRGIFSKQFSFLSANDYRWKSQMASANCC